MLWNLLGKDYSVVAYIDNDEAMWGRQLHGVPVVPPAEIHALQLDILWIATLNRESVEKIRTQLSALGYRGPVETVLPFRTFYDVRMATLRLAAQEITEKLPCAPIAELGVFQGDFAAEMNRLFPDRPIHLFDTFSGFAAQDVQEDQNRGYIFKRKEDFSQTSAELVLSKLPHPHRAIIHKGYFPETTAGYDHLQFSFVNLDADLFQPTYAGLQFFYPRLVPGGMLMVHDYNSGQFPGVKDAVDNFCSENRIMPVPLCDMHGTALFVKNTS